VTLASEYHINWQGPFSLLHPDTDSCFDCPAVNEPGVYLWTYQYHDGYLIYFAGITVMQSFAQRLKDNRRHLFRGEWTILDAASAEQGLRKELWHGTDWKGHDSPERKAEGRRRAAEIEGMARAMMGRMRVYLGPLPREQRIIERVAAGIMRQVQDCGAPFNQLPDTGMQLLPRRPNEPSITVYSHAPVKFHCIADDLIV
jgi:hypothetical protein